METKNAYSFQAKRINGTAAELSDYRGKVTLIVNVASQCGLTPQYEGLEKVYERFHAEGFEILAFPANEFAAQEPGTNAEIQSFCQGNFGVKFPLFEKTVVKGSGQHPLFAYLTEAKPTARLSAGPSFEEKLKGYGITRENKRDILWNFEKFLVGKNGEIIERFSPEVTPDDPMVTEAIERAISAKT